VSAEKDYADRNTPREFEVWTEPRDDGRVDWSMRMDRLDLGGGTAKDHAACLWAASRFLADTGDGTMLISPPGGQKGGPDR
jgi:hypothetical protein